MNCDNRRMVEFGATTAPQNAAKTLLNRYVERASIAWHVTEFASRRVSCINYLTVWRVCTQELWKKKNRPEITRVTVPWSERDQKNSKSVLESVKKSSILTCLCRISEQLFSSLEWKYESTKWRQWKITKFGNTLGISLSGMRNIHTSAFSPCSVFLQGTTTKYFLLLYTFFYIEIVAPPKNGNKRCHSRNINSHCDPVLHPVE